MGLVWSYELEEQNDDVKESNESRDIDLSQFYDFESIIKKFTFIKCRNGTFKFVDNNDIDEYYPSKYYSSWEELNDDKDAYDKFCELCILLNKAT